MDLIPKKLESLYNNKTVGDLEHSITSQGGPMKNTSLNKHFIPGFIVGALLLSFNAGALQQPGSVEKLTTACEQELQTICGRLDEPSKAIMCLKENEPQLETKACRNEVQLLNREARYVPSPIEEPFRSPETNQIQ
jgi:hypothetical protein